RLADRLRRQGLALRHQPAQLGGEHGGELAVAGAQPHQPLGDVDVGGAAVEHLRLRGADGVEQERPGGGAGLRVGGDEFPADGVDAGGGLGGGGGGVGRRPVRPGAECGGVGGGRTGAEAAGGGEQTQGGGGGAAHGKSLGGRRPPGGYSRRG